jgi:hypothetical protein
MNIKSRREFLKAALVGTGLVWAVPIVTAQSAGASLLHLPGLQLGGPPAGGPPAGGPQACCTGSGFGLAVSGALVIPPLGVSGEPCAASVDLPALGLGAGLLCASFDPNSCTASASVASVVVGAISATALSATARQSPHNGTCTSSGSATIGSLTINGSSVSVSAAPNTVVKVDDLTTVTLNEQKTNADGSFTVTAVHIRIDVPLLGLGTDIYLAQAKVHNTCCGGVISAD